ncbi:MAG: glycine cleavage system aminomethyltransferase GcvT [Deltaproteobacteria bacterium]|nr:glycine cleavage system aminomethyltransferase GcvT [Deltaproteobacteria bacterium]
MLKQTPLNSIHRALGAKLVEFGGWEMPVQYQGIIDEHLAVRRTAGLFDVSHMGEIAVDGPKALDYIQLLTINDAAALSDGQVQYTAMCYPDGGVVDDMTLYRFGPERFLFCVNASNIDKDFAWMLQILKESGLADVELRNLSPDYGQIALQGPSSAAILAGLTSENFKEIDYYHFKEGPVAGIPTIISRTGYTGEDGFELYVPTAKTADLWDALMQTGKKQGLVPAGLGCRDTLRLEKKYALYGHEISADISPLEGGLAWITKLQKPDFVGRKALVRQKENGVPRRLACLILEEPGVPRQGYPVFSQEHHIGEVTSGTMSPSLKKGIALALIKKDSAVIGDGVQIGIRDKKRVARIIKPPFYPPAT